MRLTDYFITVPPKTFYHRASQVFFSVYCQFQNRDVQASQNSVLTKHQYRIDQATFLYIYRYPQFSIIRQK